MAAGNIYFSIIVEIWYKINIIYQFKFQIWCYTHNEIIKQLY